MKIKPTFNATYLPTDPNKKKNDKKNKVIQAIFKRSQEDFSTPNQPSPKKKKLK